MYNAGANIMFPLMCVCVFVSVTKIAQKVMGRFDYIW